MGKYNSYKLHIIVDGNHHIFKSNYFNRLGNIQGAISLILADFGYKEIKKNYVINEKDSVLEMFIEYSNILLNDKEVKQGESI